MNPDTAEKLSGLSADYETVVGNSFQNFFCPILFRDEPTELARAHIVNKAFPDSSRRWTIQRKDVDGFFGSVFERDFVLLKERGKHDLLDVLADRKLSSRLSPKVLVDGTPVPHYLPKGEVPPYHSQLIVERGDIPSVRLAIKMELDEMLAADGARLEFAIEKDVRLPTLVSLLKAAHLTLFELLGYGYALTAAGRFMGWDVLGSFVSKSIGEERSVVIENAFEHFPQFVNLVRPMLKVPDGIAGTISDGHVFVCIGTPVAWAIGVFVRTGDQMHMVLVPVLEDDESAARLIRFLKEPNGRFEGRVAELTRDQLKASTTSQVIEWPEAGFLSE